MHRAGRVKINPHELYLFHYLNHLILVRLLKICLSVLVNKVQNYEVIKVQLVILFRTIIDKLSPVIIEISLDH